MTYINLKQICDQLTEAMCLPEGYRVAAVIDENNKTVVQEWCVVRMADTGRVVTIGDESFKTIKELLEHKWNEDSKQ